MMPSDLIGQIMRRDVQTVAPSDPLKYALERMLSKDIGNVVAVENEVPVGIVTERDILRKIAKGEDVPKLLVRDIMSSPVVTVTPKNNGIEALEIMHRKNIRRLPVVDEGRLVGIVTQKDLVYWVLRVAYAPYPPQ